MFSLTRLRRWLTQRILHRKRIPLPLWRQVIEQQPLLSQLDKREAHRLRRLASLFLHQKSLVGAGGLELDDFMRVTIAAQACLLVLNLDLDYYEGWSEIIVYPGAFLAPHRQQDEAGVVSEGMHGLSGESWGRGPAILSWDDIEHPRQGSSVVLHEFAHKLDFLDGAANGIPSLHSGVVRERWTEDFTEAYNDLHRRLERRHQPAIDPYAAESPAEFFAVVTEVFFQDPQRLHANYPVVYDEMRRFYRQDPLARSE